jgi:hypothetical protein
MDEADILDMTAQMADLWPGQAQWPDGTMAIAAKLFAPHPTERVVEAMLALWLEGERFVPHPGQLANKIGTLSTPSTQWAEVWAELLHERSMPRPWSKAEWSEAVAPFIALIGTACLAELLPSSETPLSVTEGQLRRKWVEFASERDTRAAYAVLGEARLRLLAGRGDRPVLPEVIELAKRLPAAPGERPTPKRQVT